MNNWNDLITGIVISALVFSLLLRYLYYPLRRRIEFGSENTFVAALAVAQEKVFFWLILLLALVVRLWGFGDVPGGFNQDGAMAAVDAKALSDYGTDRFGMRYPVHFTAWSYGQMSVLLSYLMLPFMKVAGVNEVTARLPVLLISMAGILALYGLIKDATNKTTALIVMFLAAINPWHIMQSRWALDCNLFPHFFIIGCYLLNLGREKTYMLYLGMFSFALCMYSYGIAFFSVPLFLFTIALVCIVKKIYSIKVISIAVGVYAFFSWPIWAVMIINFMKWPTIETPFFTIPFFPGSVRSSEILFFSSNISAQLATNFGALIKTSFTQGPDLPWNAINDYGTQYKFALPLVLLGAAMLLKSSFSRVPAKAAGGEVAPEKFVSIILLAALLMSLWVGLVIGSVNVNRINIIYYFLIICAGLGLVKLAHWFKPFFYFILLLYFSFFISFCNYYYGKWSEEISLFFFKGMGDALEEAAKIETPRYYITVNSQFDGARTVSEILTLFHHDVDAKYFQGASISELEGALSSGTASGNEHGKLYSDRYKYINPKRFSISPDEQAVYIIRTAEKRRFDKRYFKFIDFVQYSLVIPKSLDHQRR